MVTNLLDKAPAAAPVAAQPVAPKVAPAATDAKTPVAEPAEPAVEAAATATEPAGEPEAKQAGEAPKADEAAAESPYAALAIPEDSKLKPEDLAEVVELAGRLELPVEAAAEILAMREGFIEKREAEYAAMADSWAADVEADPEIGGDKLPDTMAAAHAAIAEHGPPGFLEVLVSSRLGNFKPFIQFASSVGRKLVEPKTVQPVTTAQKVPLSEEEKWALRFKNSGPMPRSGS